MNSQDTESRFALLSDIIKGSRSLLIFTHPQPDPDTLASAFALHRIAKLLERKATIYIASELGRPENKTMARLLRIPLRNLPARIPKGAKALVDAQPGSHAPKKGERFDIVFDHHPLAKQTKNAKFWDVRPQCGSCATILTEYLSAAGIQPDKFLATALFYAIRTDVGELARKLDESDIRAMRLLFPYISNQLLRKIERPRLPLEFFSSLQSGLNTAVIHGKLITAKLPKGTPPEIAALLSDLLLRAQGMSWSFCATEDNGILHFSIRSIRPGKRAGEIARRLASRRGTGGGHHLSAGGQIRLDKTSFEELYPILVERLRRMLGQKTVAHKKLIPEEPCEENK